jgi:hypothetical protein
LTGSAAAATLCPPAIDREEALMHARSKNIAGDVANAAHPDAIRAATRPLRHGLWALGAAWLATVAFMAPRLGAAEPPIQPVIRVERLEIVEPDGTLAFVLANSHRPAPATIDGQVIMSGQEAERRNPSFIFFDGKGDEVGGMMFSTGPGDGVATRHLSLDGWKQDQTVVLAHYQNARGASSGLSVSDRPQDRSLLEAMAEIGLEPGASRLEFQAAIARLPAESRDARLRELFGVQRAFVGSNWSDDAVLQLNDGAGRARIIIAVPEDGAPYIRVLDAAGAVVLELPERG